MCFLQSVDSITFVRLHFLRRSFSPITFSPSSFLFFPSIPFLFFFYVDFFSFSAHKYELNLQPYTYRCFFMSVNEYRELKKKYRLYYIYLYIFVGKMLKLGRKIWISKKQHSKLFMLFIRDQKFSFWRYFLFYVDA